MLPRFSLRPGLSYSLSSYSLYIGGLCLVLLTACASAAAPIPTAVAVDLAADQGGGACIVKIGIVTSLSGEYRTRAVELVRGYDMARDDINAQGGVLDCPLELIYRDDASISAQAAQAMQTLAENDQVLLVAGSFASVITLDLVPLSSQYQIPLLAHNATNFLITDLRYKWVFRTIASSWDSLDQLLAYVSQLPFDDLPGAGLLYEDSAYGQSLYVSVLSRLKHYGVSLVAAQTFPAGADDYRPLLERISASGANMLFLAGNSVPDGLKIMEQVRELDLNFKVYMAAGGAYTSSEFLRSPYSDYFIAPVPWVDNSQSTNQQTPDQMSKQASAEFIMRFTERYGSAPGYRSVNAYVNIWLAKTAIEKAFATPSDVPRTLKEERNAIRAALQTLDLKETLFGPIRFDAFGQNMAKTSLAQTVGGKFIVVSSADETGNDAAKNLVFPAPDWADRKSP